MMACIEREQKTCFLHLLERQACDFRRSCGQLAASAAAPRSSRHGRSEPASRWHGLPFATLHKFVSFAGKHAVEKQARHENQD
jgi:hypothetical protein